MHLTKYNEVCRASQLVMFTLEIIYPLASLLNVKRLYLPSVCHVHILVSSQAGPGP